MKNREYINLEKTKKNIKKQIEKLEFDKYKIEMEISKLKNDIKNIDKIQLEIISKKKW
jgi:seryl-tRNA synthetase